MLISYLASRMLNHPTRSDYVQGSKDAMVERPSARRVGRGCTGRPAHSHSVISTIVNLRHYLFRSFCQGCCLWDSIRFRIVIVPITGTIPVFSPIPSGHPPYAHIAPGGPPQEDYAKWGRGKGYVTPELSFRLSHAPLSFPPYKTTSRILAPILLGSGILL